MVGEWLLIILTSAAPISELRGGIPLAMGVYHWPWWQALPLAAAANWLAAAIWLGFIILASDWLSRHSRHAHRFFAWLFQRTHTRHNRSFKRWGALALVLFVAIPLPFTGAWSGAVAAFVFGVPYRRALLLLALGILLAGLAVTILSGGIIALAT